MIEYTTGNLLDTDAEALVNTVNTVGVMGKGIALMFKEAFPENYQAYRAACKAGEVRTGKMFVTERNQLVGPRLIINFPTKRHWRGKSSPEWIEQGLEDLKRVIRDYNITSIALPPLGSGNGGLEWAKVKPRIERALAEMPDVHVRVFEPSTEYQNVTQRNGKEALTPARALVTELVRRYSVLGMDCSLLEIQKLAWLLERCIVAAGLKDPLDLRFQAHRYGPYADRLRHLLDALDGSYLHCEKRLADSEPTDVIWFEHSRKEKLQAYLGTGEARTYSDALEEVGSLIDGFQSPLGMELLATVGWLLSDTGAEPTLSGIKAGLREWPGGEDAGQRKLRLFDDRMIELALQRLQGSSVLRNAPDSADQRATFPS
jgi:O-acetyl-ADP-ribose deacetylase (regulator of RNase III)